MSCHGCPLYKYSHSGLIHDLRFINMKSVLPNRTVSERKAKDEWIVIVKVMLLFPGYLGCSSSLQTSHAAHVIGLRFKCREAMRHIIRWQALAVSNLRVVFLQPSISWIKLLESAINPNMYGTPLLFIIDQMKVQETVLIKKKIDAST